MPQTDKGIYSTAIKIRKEFGNTIADCYINCARDNGIILSPIWEGEKFVCWTGVMRMPTNIVSFLSE